VAKLTLNDKIVTAAEISQDTGKLLQPESVSQKTLDIALEPGDGRMYQLSRNK
jgi:hypothetical protein